MRRFVEGIDRGQATLFPECLEDWIDEDNPIWVGGRCICRQARLIEGGVRWSGRRGNPILDMHAPCLWSPLSALIAGEAGLDRMLYEAKGHEFVDGQRLE